MLEIISFISFFYLILLYFIKTKESISYFVILKTFHLYFNAIEDMAILLNGESRPAKYKACEALKNAGVPMIGTLSMR